MKNKFYQIYSFSQTSRSNPDENEDSHFCFSSTDNDDFVLLLVCDGLGGAPGGQTASLTLRDKVKETFSDDLIKELTSLKTPDNIKTKLSEVFTNILVQTQSLLLEAFHFENNSRKGKGQPLLPEKHKRGGFSTTFSCGIIINKMLYYCWVGDSRVYLIRDGRLKILTFDHSDGVVQENFNELEELFAGKVMSKCISPFADEEFVKITETEIFNTEIKNGDVVLAASDGIFDYLLPWTLEMVLIKNLSFGYSVKEYVHKTFYQIKPVFQDDTTVSVAFCGTIKPFGAQFPYIEDAFFYLNESTFNSKIDSEFNKIKTSWDDVDKLTDWELYKERKPWSEILSGESRLTEKQNLPGKLICSKCMSSFIISEQIDKCPGLNCNGSIYNGHFIEIYRKNNPDYSNPYKIHNLLLNKSGKGNIYVISPQGIFDTQNYNHFDFSGLETDVVIKNIDGTWEIELRSEKNENELFVFYPEVFSLEGKSFNSIKNIQIGNDSFHLEYPYKGKKNQFYLGDDSYSLDKKTVYLYGKTNKNKTQTTIKNKTVKYIPLEGDYLDINSGMISYQEEGQSIVLQDAKWDNGLFISTGEKILRFKEYPVNAIIRFGDYFFSFRESIISKTGV